MERLLIRELVARYKLEPDIRDIYVEGKFDSDIVRWYLKNSGYSNVAVLRTEDVELPASLLSKYGLAPGEKSRVLALASELATHTGQESTQVTCVVDADCDRILGKKIDCGLVLTTDYTCMEMYLANEQLLGKFFNLVLGIDEIDVSALLKQYRGILQELFLIRAAIESLGLQVSWIDFTSYCQKSSEQIEFYCVEFIRNLLQNSSLIDEREALLERVEELRLRLPHDIRDCMNGHDFLALLAFDRRSVANRRGLRSQEAVTASLRGCLDFLQLRGEAMFVNIESRMKP